MASKHRHDWWEISNNRLLFFLLVSGNLMEGDKFMIGGIPQFSSLWKPWDVNGSMDGQGCAILDLDLVPKNLICI